MSWQTIRTLVVKDFTLFFRNRFFAFISIAALVAYGVLYFLMPSEVDETLRIGLFGSEFPPEITEQISEEGMQIMRLDSEEELKTAVLDAEITAGFVLPDDLMSSLAGGGKPEVRIYFPADLPQEAKDIYVLMLEELSFAMVGEPLNIDVSEEILGADLVGQQIPLRDHLLPLIAVFILMMETLGLASLLSDEIDSGTAQALLITPLTIRGLFAGKGVTGVGMAFIQALLLVVITGGLNQQPMIVLVALLLGALLATGVGFLLASTGKDMMGILAWGVLAILILSLPALGILFPGTISDWAKVIPSYYLVDTVNRAINYGINISLAMNNLIILLVFDVIILWLGTVALRRKLA